MSACDAWTCVTTERRQGHEHHKVIFRNSRVHEHNFDLSFISYAMWMMEHTFGGLDNIEAPYFLFFFGLFPTRRWLHVSVRRCQLATWLCLTLAGTSSGTPAALRRWDRPFTPSADTTHGCCVNLWADGITWGPIVITKCIMSPNTVISQSGPP